MKRFWGDGESCWAEGRSAGSRDGRGCTARGRGEGLVREWWRPSFVQTRGRLSSSKCWKAFVCTVPCVCVQTWRAGAPAEDGEAVGCPLGWILDEAPRLPSLPHLLPSAHAFGAYRWVSSLRASSRWARSAAVSTILSYRHSSSVFCPFPPSKRGLWRVSPKLCFSRTPGISRLCRLPLCVAAP